MSVLVALGVAVFGLVGFDLSWDAYDKGKKLRKRGVRTLATCVNEGQRRRGAVLLLEYVVAADGSRRTHTIGPFAEPPLRVGDQTVLIYDAKTPSRVSQSEEALSARTLRWTMAVSATAFLCAGSWLTWFFITF